MYNRTALWYTASCATDTGKEVYDLLNESADERETDQYDVIKDVWEGGDNTSITNLFDAAQNGCAAYRRRLIG